MADFYTGLANTADVLLKDKGQKITVVREIASYDPVTAETIVTDSTTQVLNGAVFSKSASSYDSALEEEKIKGKTKSVLLSTLNSNKPSSTSRFNSRVTTANFLLIAFNSIGNSSPTK